MNYQDKLLIKKDDFLDHKWEVFKPVAKSALMSLVFMTAVDNSTWKNGWYRVNI